MDTRVSLVCGHAECVTGFLCKRVDDETIVYSEAEAIAYLTKDGNFDVPCSRYGRDSRECATVAWQIADYISNLLGEYTLIRDLDYVMGLVVNDSDDVTNVLTEQGDNS